MKYTNAVEALAARKEDFVGLASVHRDKVIRFLPYNAKVAEIARSLPGSFYDKMSKNWSWKPRYNEDIDKIISGLKEINSIQRKPRQRLFDS
jgi:hypothetical protein